MTRTKLKEHIIPYTPRASFLTLLQGFLLSMEAEGKSPATITAYGDCVRRFIAISKQLGLPQDAKRLTRDHVRAYVIDLRHQGLAVATVRDYLVGLRLWLTWLKGEGMIKSNPCDGIKLPRPDRKAMKTLETDKVKQLLDVARRQPERKALRDELIILLFFDTGLRASELVGLNMEDVDLNRRLIFVRGKGRKERVLGLQGRTCVMAWQYVANVRDLGPGPFILGKTGQRMLRTSITQCLAKLAKKAGWPAQSCSPHMLRRSFAVEYLRAGGDPFTLQILLGHERLEMSRHYAEALNARDAVKAQREHSPAAALFRQ